MTKKTGRIEICDSKKRKGEYFVRYIGANGKKLAHSETLTTRQNVNKNILAMHGTLDRINYGEFETILANNIIDRTREGWWSKKFGIEHKPITQ